MSEKPFKNQYFGEGVLNENTSPRPHNKQQGVVLIVALVFLVALTGVAAMLMQNTTSDMKMVGAGNEKLIATQAAISAIDEVIDNQINLQPTNGFAQGLRNVVLLNSAQLLPAGSIMMATASITVLNNPPNFESVSCGRSINAISDDEVKCNVMQLQTQRLYGRNNSSTIQVNASIAQILLP